MNTKTRFIFCLTLLVIGLGVSAANFQPDTVVIHYIPNEERDITALAEQMQLEDTLYGVILHVRGGKGPIYVPTQYFIVDTTTYSVPDTLVKNYHQYYWEKVIPMFYQDKKRAVAFWKKVLKNKVLYFCNDTEQEKVPKGTVWLRKGVLYLQMTNEGDWK